MMVSLNLVSRIFKTPIGDMEVGLNQNPNGKDKFSYFAFDTQSLFTGVDSALSHPLLDLAEQQLTEYFAGKRTDFDELLPLLDFQGTDFQNQVWQGLTQIKYGETWSYGQLANQINNPKAVRAVGAANGKNPFSVVVPCHRVIGANGNMMGYAGGVDKKVWLLQLESKR